MTKDRNGGVETIGAHNVLQQPGNLQAVAKTKELLSADFDYKFWRRLKAIDAAPRSEKIATFRTCAESLARLFGRELSRSDIADRLHAKATSSGLVVEFGEDAIQKILAEALEVPIHGDEQELFADDARPPEFSDEFLALLFAEQHGETLKYVAQWDKWLVWSGAHWVPDETLKVIDFARHVCRQVASTCKSERIASAVASKKTVSAILSLARADRKIGANTEQWDRDPWLLNTPSAIIDLRSGKLRPHDPSDFMTKITAVPVVSACPIPLWQAFLDRVTGSDVEFIKFLQRVCGYALTGLTSEHALFFFYGTGANGKSTFLNTIIGCIGGYHRAAPIETFTASKGERHPTELAGLRGARLVTAVETEEGRRWAESRIKSLTGGDKIAARFMRQDFFEFWPIFKLLIAGNHRPGLRSVDEAIRRRFHLLPFTRVVPEAERDPDLVDKLKAEWPGILAWMIEGCLEWQLRGLNPPTVVREATEEYLAAEDSFAAWLDQDCDNDPHAFELTKDLYDSWKRYARGTGEYEGSEKRFSQKLRERNSTGHHGFWGLRLRPAAHAASDDAVPL